jgi:hypothetical protein
MSHVTDMKLHIKDLDCLKKAAKALGMDLVKASKFKWFGQHVGDYPLPQGFTKEDMGKCDYVLRIKGNDHAYEVGVCKRRDGKPGYTLLWDFWRGGYGLEAAIGKDGGKLKQNYAVSVAKKQMAEQGLDISTKVKQDGTIVLTAGGLV